MSEALEFTVFGTPAPAGSKRAFVVAGRARVTDANAKAKPWKAEIRQAVGRAMEGKDLLQGPLEVSFVFYAKRPQGHYRTGKNAGVVKDTAPGYPTVKPDALKLARSVEDALTGVVYHDDSQIVIEHLEKRYGVPERVVIRIRRLDG